MPEDIKILQFQLYYAKQVQDLILHIQNDEFSVGISLEMQPDLLDINSSYIQPGGNFFIATYEDQAAIRFYTKNGFNLIEPSDLPEYFPKMKVDNVFFYKSI